MAISYPLTAPAINRFRSFRARTQSAIGATSSPSTFQQQIYVHPGQMWGPFDAELVPLERDEAADWIAFLLSLNGREGTFLMGMPLSERARGSASGSPVVSGAGQTGQTLATGGWTAGVTNIMRKGDFLQLGSSANAHMHMVLSDANSNGSGAASLSIWPRLRESPANGSAIVVTNPVGLWRLTGDENEWDLARAQRYGLAFSCMEALS